MMERKIKTKKLKLVLPLNGCLSNKMKTKVVELSDRGVALSCHNKATMRFLKVDIFTLISFTVLKTKYVRDYQDLRYNR
jgi:hypothetical protein